MDFSFLLMLVLMGAALYFLMIRPQQKRAKQQQQLLSELAPGARVMTISGIVGTIKYLGDKQAILEVSPGVEMTLDKRALSTQPFEDEFEYADEPAEADTVADVEPEPTAEPAPIEPAPEQDAIEPAENPDATWDNPGTEKN